MAVGGRRLWRAALLTLVAFLLVATSIGFVVATEQDAIHERALAVPAPQPGARATYEIHEIVLNPDAVTSTIVPKRATYEWLPERVEMDSEFSERLVRPLRSTFTFSDRTLARETAYDATTGAVVSESSISSWDRGGYWGSSAGVGGTRVDTNGRFDAYQGQIGPCGFGAPVRGQEHHGGDIVIQGRCDLSGRNEFSLSDQGWSNTNQGRVREFRSAEDPQIFLQFDDVSPFPARASAALSEVYTRSALAGRTFVLERIETTGGTGTYTAPEPSPHAYSGGPVPSAPTTPWAFDETGLPHQRFPLSEAYEAALTQQTIPDSSGRPAGPDASQWLAEHPAAYLASAMPYEGRDRTDQPVVSWFLAWTDGTEVLGKQVAYAPAGVQFLYLPNATGYQKSVYDWDTKSAWSTANSGSAPWTPDWSASWPWHTEGLAQPQDVPQALPRPADLMERFVAIGGDGPNIYGFSIECADDACSKATVIVVAGHSVESWDNRYTSQYDVLVHPLYSTNDLVVVDGEGRLESRWRHSSLETAAFPVLPAPASAPPPSDSTTGPGPGTFRPLAAAGISVVALLVGGLYYFWPVLKGMPALRLFSRTEDEHLLDHPTRLRIHDAIQCEPGIHFMALARKAGVGQGTLDHHLRKLTAAGLVTVRKASGYKCYFAKGAAHRSVVQAAPLLRSQGSRAVFEAIGAAPGISGRELARRLGRSPSTVHHHVRRLEAAGLVLGDGDGMRLSPRGERANAST